MGNVSCITTNPPPSTLSPHLGGMPTEVYDSMLVDTPSAAALPTSPTPASPTRRPPRRATVQATDDHDRHNDHNDRPAEEAPPVVDDPHSRSYPPLPPIQPIVEPHHPEFTPSENAENRYAVEDVYEFGDQLGQGAFGAVFLARHKTADMERPWSAVAIKRASPNSTDTDGGRRPIWALHHLESQVNEIKSLCHLREPSAAASRVVHLYEYYLASSREFYMVTELLGMELEEYKTSDLAVDFNENTVRAMSRTILRALQYMHSKGVVHRDLKMQNILFARNGDCSSLKIVDFGLSKILCPNDKANEICGTNGYIAPEIYKGSGYRFEVDLFAFGVLLFRLLSDERPFAVGDSALLRRRTIELRYHVVGEAWDLVSANGRDMVRKLLINRDQRLTAEQALRHAWMHDATQSRLRVQGTLSRAPGVRRDRSRNAILEPPPENPGSMTLGVSSRYWIDMSMKESIEVLIFTGTFQAELVDEQTGIDGEEGMVCYRERTPPGAVTLAKHIGGFDRYTERNCRDIFKGLVSRVQILHESSVAHRNLHPENVLVQPDNNVSLKGFHFAQLIRHDRPLTGHFGYLYSWYAFKAPEVDQSFAHDRSVDVWSLGAILYMMLTGLPPFRGEGMELVDAKHAGIFDFEPVIPSGGAQRLTRRMLNIMPEERYTIHDILQDPWMEAENGYLEQFDLDFAREQTRFW